MNKTSKSAKRPVFVPYVLRKGMAIDLPLFGPASATREDAQARLDDAMRSGAYASGQVREVY